MIEDGGGVGRVGERGGQVDCAAESARSTSRE